MRKLVVLISVALGLLLLTPAAASASTLSLKSLAKTVTALQKQVSTLKAQVTTLRGTVTTQAATIAGLQSVVGADASHGLQLAVSDLQSNLSSLSTTVAGQTTTLTNAADVLALEPYVTVSSSAINGVAGPNIVFTGLQPADQELDQRDGQQRPGQPDRRLGRRACWWRGSYRLQQPRLR